MAEILVGLVLWVVVDCYWRL